VVIPLIVPGLKNLDENLQERIDESTHLGLFGSHLGLSGSSGSSMHHSKSANLDASAVFDDRRSSHHAREKSISSTAQAIPGSLPDDAVLSSMKGGA